jgi:signal transduction histidine kinase
MANATESTLELAAPRAHAIARLAQTVLPRLGDACAVVLLDEGGRLHHSVGAHVDGQRSELMRAAGVALAATGQPPLCRLIDSENPLLLDAADAELASTAKVGAALRALGGRSLVCAPIRWRGAGMLTVMSELQDRWDSSDLLVVRALSRSIEGIIEPEADPRADADELIAAVHHDLGNPLHAVSLNLEFALSAMPEHDRRASRPVLEQARQSVRRMQHLVSELDEYLHGRLHPDVDTSTTAAAAVGEILAMLCPVASDRSIRLIASVSDGDAVVAMPPRHLFRILSNVVGNALKYAEPNTEVVIATARRDDKVRFAVTDHGPGIAPEDCGRLFDREWLAQSPLRKGSGLGLAIAKRLVEACGGTIGVSSRLGEGSCFIVTVPAR